MVHGRLQRLRGQFDDRIAERGDGLGVEVEQPCIRRGDGEARRDEVEKGQEEPI